MDEVIRTNMIVPMSIMNILLATYEGDYLEDMALPYKESILAEAKDKGVGIGEIKSRDYGMCPKEYVAELNRQIGYGEEHDCAGRVIMFYAEVVTENVAV